MNRATGVSNGRTGRLFRTLQYDKSGRLWRWKEKIPAGTLARRSQQHFLFRIRIFTQGNAGAARQMRWLYVSQANDHSPVPAPTTKIKILHWILPVRKLKVKSISLFHCKETPAARTSMYAMDQLLHLHPAHHHLFALKNNISFYTILGHIFDLLIILDTFGWLILS